MKRVWLCLALFSLLVLAACGKQGGQQKQEEWVSYTFEDSGVHFSIEYLESWKLVEQLGWEGDATRDASPEAGVQFQFSQDETQVFTLGAMRFAPLTPLGDGPGEAFATNDSLTGNLSRLKQGENTIVLYLYGEDFDTLPQYFALVNMSQSVYEKHQDQIDRVVKSLKILTD